MSKEIDTGITEQDLFEAVMADLDPYPHFDPSKHLDPQVAAERWGVCRSTAIDRLSRDARLRKVMVRGAKGKPMTAFVRAE